MINNLTTTTPIVPVGKIKTFGSDGPKYQITGSGHPSSEGEWLDIAEWRNEAAARAAGKVFHQLSQAQIFCSMIDASSIKVSHHPIVTAG